VTEFRLDSKFIPEGHRVWLMYSGKRRRFFRHFADSNSVFLELPGFSASANTFDNPDRIRQHLRMSDEIRKWHRDELEDPPSRIPDSYSSLPRDVDERRRRGFNAEVGNIQRFFKSAQAGDLVISPATGHYDPMLIGEIAGDWDTSQALDIPQLYGEEVPIRNIKWIRRDISRREFSTATARSLQNQHAFSELDESYYEEIYKTVYRNFFWGNKSKMDFLADKYSSNDPLETVEAATLIKYFVAAYSALENGRESELSGLDIRGAIETFYDASLVFEFSQNFNSPGKFTLIGAGVLALMVGIGVAAAVDPSSAEDLFASFNLSSGASDAPEESLLEIESKVKDLINGIGQERFQELKSYGTDAREKIDIRSSVGRYDL
jgi:hypothetical protein